MLQQVDRLVAQNKVSLGQGMSLIKLVQWIAAHDPADLTRTPYWHLVGQYEVTYYRVNTA